MEQQKIPVGKRLMFVEACKDPSTGAKSCTDLSIKCLCFNDTDHASNLFALKEQGYIYTRIHNPTATVFGGEGCAVRRWNRQFGGCKRMAANYTGCFKYCRSWGWNCLLPSLYGGTWTRNNTLDMEFKRNLLMRKIRKISVMPSLLKQKQYLQKRSEIQVCRFLI